VVVLRDISDLRRIEAARREFVSSVSHELKTPLTAIAGFAETLLDGAVEDRQLARDFVGKIARHADRLTVLVRDVLTLSRLEQGAWPMQPVALDVPELARALADEHQAAATERHVRIAVEGPDRLSATIDRQGGQVAIRVAADGDRLRLAVADTGIGIPDEHRERVFERFYRVDAHRSRISGGTGLGLAIVKQLTETLHGSIALSSSPQGSTFALDLPLEASRPGR
jgi:two-component system, OmpR family, phosphate regulon sensor histidine kinase PhoR